MFNKIFRRGKTTKDDVPPQSSYKNTLKSPADYEYGPKNYNLNNNKSTYSGQPTYKTSGPNKYATTNNVPPPWSNNYDSSSKYDNSPVNRSQNVYTAPPQRNLPYNQQSSNSSSNTSGGREYDKPFQQQFVVGSPNPNQYAPQSSYKNSNLGYSNKHEPSSTSSSRYDTTSGDRSPYIALGSTYSQSRPQYESFKRDGSASRTNNSQPGTPTATRRDILHDPNSYANRNVYRSTPNRTFESPAKDSTTGRVVFSPVNNNTSNNRYDARTYESPFRENVNKSNIGQYNNLPNYTSDTSGRSFTSPYNYTSHTPSSQEPVKYDSNRNLYNSNFGNSTKNYYNDTAPSTYGSALNSNNIKSPIQNPQAPEPGKYIPYAVRKALKESQEAQQTTNNEPKMKSPYRSVEQSPYVELSNSRVGSTNYESPASRLASPPLPPYKSKLYGQTSYNDAPELPPKNPLLKTRTSSEINRNFLTNKNTTPQSPITPPNLGYNNINTTETKSPSYVPFTNQIPYTPSYNNKLPPPSQSQHDYINLSASPKPYISPQFNTDTTTNRNQNVYGSGYNTNTAIDHTNASNANNYTSPSHFKDSTTPNYKSNTSNYEPQKNLYDTTQSYVQTPLYNYNNRSGEPATTTKTNTNVFSDWLPNTASNLNENSPYGSTRNESELWKREKDNDNADNKYSSTAFGTVPSNLNASNYFNDKNNLTNRNLNNDSSFNKKENNFDRYSTSQKQQKPKENLKSSLSNKNTDKPSTSASSSNSFSIASPLREAASISTPAANVSYQPKNVSLGLGDDDEREIKVVTSEETTNSSLPKKSVKFFNPIDKSRDFISDIMAKGRNRGHHNKNRNNNSNNKKINKNDTIKSALIMSNERNSELNDFEDINSSNESEILNNLKNNNDNNKNKSENNLETDSNKIGYQITKSKNSRDIVRKLQNSRAKLASPEEDETDNNFDINNRNSVNKQKKRFDDDTTDNTDTETFEEEDDDTITKSSNLSSKNNAFGENKIKSSSGKSYSTSQNKNRKSESACDNKFNNIESSSGKLSAKNDQQQQPSSQQVYHQQSFAHNSNVPSVNENILDRNNSRSSVRVGSSQSSTRDSPDRDFYANLKKHSADNNNNNKKYQNDEQIEKIEKLSELTECDRDNFIKTQKTMGQSQTKTTPTTSVTTPESPRFVRSRSSSPPKRSTSKSPQLNSSDYAEIYQCSTQHASEPVIEEPLSPKTPLSPTESCDQFYDLANEATTSSSNNPTAFLPRVTVADYSEDSHSSNVEPDIFYDFDTVTTNLGSGSSDLSKSPPKYPPPPPSPSAQFKSRSTSPIDIVTLEDIEEEEDEDDWHFVNDNDSKNNENTTQQQQQQNSTPNNENCLNSPTLNRKKFAATTSAQQQHQLSPTLSRKSSSPQRSPFDYDDHRRDGLNTPDSGIGGASTPVLPATINSTRISSTTTTNSSTNSSSKVLVINSCDLVNDTDDIELLHSHQKQKTTSNYYNNSSSNTNTINFCETNNNSFIETSDNCVYSSTNNATSIVIDSLSLPDVVIESKPKETESQNGSSSTLSVPNDSYVLNVSKSKSEGNVHFIPIHVEGREKPKIEIVEETTEFSGSTIVNSNNSITDNFETSTFNINNGFIEDISNVNNSNNIDEIRVEETVTTQERDNENYNSYDTYTVPTTNLTSSEITENIKDYKRLEKELQEKLKKTKEEKQKKEDELKRELVNQEARFNAQLQEAQRNASSAQERAHELQMKIDTLEQDISLKSWHIERLNGEIQAIQQEHCGVRKRLQTIEDEKERIRQKHFDAEDEFNIKYENLEEKYKELEEKYAKLRQLATSLQTQLAYAKAQTDELQIAKEKLCDEKDAELKTLQELLDKAIEERRELEIKWHKEFELLRNHNQEHEEQLLTDCEFQLRSMQKKCKEKIEAAENEKQEVLERNSELEEKVAEGEGYNERLRNLQAEVRQIRGLTNEQRESITYMHQQIEELKNDLEAANNDLESKIEEVRKIKLYCDNTLLFKDREMIQKIDDATREVATIWEEKLLTEMTRLTNELEAVHSEERLSDMNKLQAEHIEELKVLTNRYTSNEEELRKELEEVSEKLQSQTEQYKQLREKTDKEILTTRIHLDKADREYQQAMNRELARKEVLEDKLRKDFEDQKIAMDAQFKERVREMKEDFKKEMTSQTQEIAQRHRQQLEQQWDQLVAEKEDALQTLEKRHKMKMEDNENRIRNLEVQHRRDLQELKEVYDLDRSSLQNRDIHNSQEIEQLHRKCRCLTNLFEEMRLRYERREPRPEDLREIDELRARCDSQERDLCELTERLREMQIQMEEMQATTNEHPHPQRGVSSSSSSGRKKPIRKPPPKQIPISCDVIYEEENEETESLVEDTTAETTATTKLENGLNGENCNNSIHQKADEIVEKEEDEEEDEEEEDE